MTTTRIAPTASVVGAAIGPWEVWPGKGFSSRAFWVLARRNPAWRLGREYLLNASRRDERRFYAQDKADAEAARRNRASKATT
jgi:hypothetical protein